MKFALRQSADRDEYRPGAWDYVAAACMAGLILGPFVVGWLVGWAK